MKNITRELIELSDNNFRFQGKRLCCIYKCEISLKNIKRMLKKVVPPLPEIVLLKTKIELKKTFLIIEFNKTWQTKNINRLNYNSNKPIWKRISNLKQWDLIMNYLNDIKPINNIKEINNELPTCIINLKEIKKTDNFRFRGKKLHLTYFADISKSNIKDFIRYSEPKLPKQKILRIYKTQNTTNILILFENKWECTTCNRLNDPTINILKTRHAKSTVLPGCPIWRKPENNEQWCSLLDHYQIIYNKNLDKGIKLINGVSPLIFGEDMTKFANKYFGRKLSSITASEEETLDELVAIGELDLVICMEYNPVRFAKREGKIN